MKMKKFFTSVWFHCSSGKPVQYLKNTCVPGTVRVYAQESSLLKKNFLDQENILKNR